MKRRKIALICNVCSYHRMEAQIFINALNKQYFDITSIEEADFIVYMSCISVCDYFEYVEEEIREIKEEKKDTAKLIAVSCVTNQKILPLEGIDYILGDIWVQRTLEIVYEGLPKDDFSKYQQQFMIWQDTLIYNVCNGCNNLCTFCKVHYMDWKLKSEEFNDIMDNIKREVICKNITKVKIIASSVAQYGIDLYGTPRIHELISEVVNIKEIEEIEIYDMSPADISEELLEVLCKEKIKVVRISIQTVSNSLLKLMGRNHSHERTERIVKTIREKNPYCQIYTTLIAGFPTETKRDIIETAKFLKKYEIMTFFVYPFETGTLIPAGKLKQLGKQEYDWHYQKLLSFTSVINKMIKNKKM